MPPTDRRPGVRSCYFYRAYGALIASELPLPELRAAEDGDAPDIVIDLAALPGIDAEVRSAGARQIGPFLWATRDTFWLHVPGIARFRIADGREIAVEPDPAAGPDDVRPFLLGTALGVALMQRGHLMLHGNAVRVDDGCLVCVGPSGTGKSTLAAGFHRRGFQLLSDDLVMIDDQGHVRPGVPRIKLWADAARAMTIDTTPLRRIRPNLEKFSLPVHDGFAAEAVPVRAIYSLSIGNGDTLSIERLDGFAKFGEVHANTYRPQFVQALGKRARYLALCTRLAAAVPVGRVARPALGFTVEALIDGLLGDMRAPG